VSREDLRNLYQDVLVEHSRARHGYGLKADGSAESQQRNRSCGDELTLRVHAKGDVVGAVSWTGQGCAISQASASMLSDLVAGLSTQEVAERIGAFRSMVQSLGKDDGSSELLGDAVALSGVSLYPPRVNCAMLAWVALEDALRQLERGESAPTPATEPRPGT
jgi:nitrogen fixation NifU-like protein